MVEDVSKASDRGFHRVTQPQRTLFVQLAKISYSDLEIRINAPQDRVFFWLSLTEGSETALKTRRAVICIADVQKE